MSGAKRLDKATEHLRRKYGELKGVSIYSARISLPRRPKRQFHFGHYVRAKGELERLVEEMMRGEVQADCILCGRPASGFGIWVPAYDAEWVYPALGNRLPIYFLCEKCEGRKGVAETVEQVIEESARADKWKRQIVDILEKEDGHD